MWRRDALRLAAGGLSAAWVGCSRRREARHIRVATSRFLANCGFYVAYEKGFFDESGFAVELFPATRAGEGAVLLARGQLDIGFYGITPALVNVVAFGNRLRIVASRTDDTPGCSSPVGLVWRKGEYPRGLEGVRRLRGKRVCVSRRAGTAEYFMDIILEAAGMSVTDIEPVYLGGAAAIAALAGGDLDAAMTGSDLSADPTGALPYLEIGLRLSDVAPGAQTAFIEFGPRVLDADPAVGADFLAAYFRGVRAFHNGDDPEFVKETLAKGGPLAAEFEHMCRKLLTLDGSVSREHVDHYVRWAVKRGYCEKAVLAANMIDDRFLRLAHQRASRREGSG